MAQILGDLGRCVWRVASLALADRSTVLPFQRFLHMAVSAQVVKLLLDERAEFSILLVTIDAQAGPGVVHKVVVAVQAAHVVVVCMGKRER